MPSDPQMKCPTTGPDGHRRRSLWFLIYLFIYLFSVGLSCSLHSSWRERKPHWPQASQPAPLGVPVKSQAPCLCAEGWPPGQRARSAPPNPDSHCGNWWITHKQMPGKGQSQGFWHHHPLTAGKQRQSLFWGHALQSQICVVSAWKGLISEGAIFIILFSLKKFTPTLPACTSFILILVGIMQVVSDH